MNVPVCCSISVVPCAVPVLPVMGSGDSNHASPLLCLPLPSCSHCTGPLVFYSFTNSCTFCAELLRKAHFLTQIMFVEEHLPSSYGWLKPEYQLCSLQSYNQ